MEAVSADAKPSVLSKLSSKSALFMSQVFESTVHGHGDRYVSGGGRIFLPATRRRVVWARYLGGLGEYPQIWHLNCIYGSGGRKNDGYPPYIDDTANP